ncbi:MAG: ribbon-helix-helix domain-containing protein [Desulfobacterium sp.]|nr:ribbon-helix-helix domain-containing protein [Desulfobacterium sp.]
MRTIQMTLDDDLVKAVDHVSKLLKTNRSAFTRKALREALSRYNLVQMEHKHREGYERTPVTGDEFSVWDAEQDWGE